MKVEVVYTSKAKYSKKVAEDMARWARTYAKSIPEVKRGEMIDLLVISFDESLRRNKELINFIHSLTRNEVKNVALVNAFYLNNKQLHKVIKVCQQADLPLMREQYSFKICVKQSQQRSGDIINGARLYIEDMINIVRNYY